MDKFFRIFQNIFGRSKISKYLCVSLKQKIMKITYKIVNVMGSLEHSFKDETLVKGFQELEDMLGEQPDPLPRTVLLKNYMDKNGLWGKTYDNYFITNIERTEDGEFWLFTKTLN